ncbi:MAG: DNA translocase FtsK, partial [Terriglobia bacterium]
MQSASVQASRSRESKSSLLDSRRRSELLGFLLTVLGLLLALSLASYHHLDPSFDTVTSVGGVHNWVGVAGSYSADALLQIFGWTAFLIPLAFFIAGGSLFLVRPLQSPGAKILGAALLIASLAVLLEIFPRTPQVFGVIHGSGIVGYLLAAGLIRTFNAAGASIVASAAFLSSLFLVTTFSFSGAGRFLRSTSGAVFGPAGKRWSSWRGARERKQAQQRLAHERTRGKEPVVARRPGGKTEEKVKPAAPLALAGSLPSGSDGIDGEGAGNDESLVVLTGGRGQETQTAAPKIAASGALKYKLPSPSLLRPPDDQQGVDEAELKQRAQQLVSKFAEFGVTGVVTQIHPGPVVTTFEFKPEAGIKYSRITNLVDDLCLAMKAESILIERMAGKSTVGIEVPNQRREIIYLREILESSDFVIAPTHLALCLGKDFSGKVRVGDLTQMPHLLIAGSTGSGKSVAINSLIVSLLYKCTPDEVRLILIDPKRLELNLYDGIPHLFTPIVTEPKVAANVLRRATLEMEERLKKLAQHGVRNIEQYNKLFEPDSNLSLFDGNGQQESALPYLVIVIDELADLMMVEPQNVEESITRLAQMARAVGIHLILATQRPSVDVITGLIKANLPSRISFHVASKVDSRTILDSNG